MTLPCGEYVSIVARRVPFEARLVPEMRGRVQARRRALQHSEIL